MSRFPSYNIGKIAAVVITFIVIIVVMFESVVIVEAGHRGVVLYLGAVENRVQAEASAASNDLQEVQTVIALNYMIDPTEANRVYQLLGVNYADRVISPTIQEAVKASVAKFNAEELVTKRETAKGVIAQAIRNTLTSNNIIVENVFITDFKFSESFAAQIEQKVVAFQKFLTEQNNLRAVRVIANQNVVQAEAAARANIAKASGEAQAIELITGQLRSSPEYLQWQAINKWNGQLPYASGSGAVPFFQLPSPQSQPTNQTNQVLGAQGQISR